MTVWDEWNHPTIYFSPELDAIQLRCALAHELQHVEHGPPPVDLCEEDERRVRAATARWLLPDIRIVADLCAIYDVAEAARRLYVVPHIILDRIGNAWPAERAELTRLTPDLDD